MSNQDNFDISNIQVPESLIQEILEQTQPLEESREEVHPPQAMETVAEGGDVTKLLSLLFEEFDKLNSRFDKLQESINEMTTAGMLGTGYSETAPKQPRKRKKQKESTDTLAALLSRRIGR